MMDETVQVYPSPQSQIRFAIEAFKFIGMHNQVYISCAVILCEAGNSNTRCDQGCIDESFITTPPHNRPVREAVLETASHYISQGPLRMRRSTDSKAVLTLNLNLVFIGGCLLATVAMVCGVMLYRSSQSKIKYQPLPTSE
ncbi:hypothetical protein DPEC_G00010980 [Dallia pectoralis]|uniref:Uncharacterized protein n=1 Tax=Dallia pectoralis TaxID=75939 RepID=A0ACC2HLK3_DALPE|nr:hypothetical protein DPEC_G00010980 [Dallia pectoralis]